MSFQLASFYLPCADGRMLQLNDHRWHTLRHAYGDARSIPDYLIRLAVTPISSKEHNNRLWENLWSSLCHQGDTYDGAYAALPHIVEIGCNAEGPIDFGFFALPAAIEIARNKGNGPPVPDDLANPYYKGLSRIMECVARHQSEDWDRNMLLSALCAQAVAKGDLMLAEAIDNLDDLLISRLVDLDFGDHLV